MKQWEYRRIYLGSDDKWKELNTLGKEGWELVNAYYSSSGACGVLKKEIEQRPAQEVKRERPYNSYEQGYS